MVWLRRVGWVVLSVAALWAACWLGLPPLLKWQAQLRLSEALGRSVQIERVQVEPWALVLVIEGLRIGATPAPAAKEAGRDPAGAREGAMEAAPALLQIARIRIDAGMASLRHRAPVIEAIEVDGATLRLARTTEGHYDIDDLVQRFTPAPGSPPGEPLRFALYNLQLRDAHIRFDDQPVGRVHQVEALQLSLPFLSNLPSQVDIRVEPRLAFQLGDTRFDTGAQATPFARSRTARLTLTMGALDLAPYLPYLPTSLPLKLKGGEVDAKLALQFSQPEAGPTELALSGRLQARRIELTDRQDAPMLRWKQLALDLRALQPLSRQLALDRLEIDGLQLDADRDTQGALNWARLAPPPEPAPANAPLTPASGASATTAQGTPSTTPPWQISLGHLALNDASVHWRDATTRPAAALQLDGLSFSADALRWPEPQPVPMRLSAQLRQAGKGDSAAELLGQLDIDGQASPTEASVGLALSGLKLAGLAPYVAQHLVPQLSGDLTAKARLDWKSEGQALTLQLEEAQLSQLRLSLAKAGSKAAGDAFSLKQLRLEAGRLELPAQRLSLGKLLLQQPVAQLARQADGRWNVQDWLVADPAVAAPGPSTGQGKASPQASPWRISLKEFGLQAGQLTLSDALAHAGRSDKPLQLQVAGLKLGIQNLRWAGDQSVPAMQLQVAARLGAAATVDDPQPATGNIDWKGDLGISPLLVRGKLRAERLPVQVVEPYFAQLLPVSLVRAEAGYLGEIDVLQQGGDWRIGTRGDVVLGDVQVNARRADGAAGEELLNWQRLALDGLQFSQAPGQRPQLVVRESALSDFYSRLVITEQGRFNLQDVGAAPPEAAASAASAASPASETQAAAPAMAPRVATAASDAASGTAAAAPKGLPIDLQLGPTKLVNGRVDFTDRFVRPNYSADLSELNGQLGAFRSDSREMASLSLRGRAAGTALLDISGQLNPTAEPLALDIRARATDLELAPLSPYAGKYAGYAIERGKLSMDVAYKIDPDGKLDAKNQVVLNQLSFGERIESPQATKLPVLLAVALLKDRNGVIDINLPVSGSVNDPQFSVGGIILKVILNLLGKALTAPFALLGGGSDDLSQVEFKPGTATVNGPSEAVLDKVAKALNDRPALKMTVTGAADPVSEAEAYRREALETRLQAEHRRELVRKGGSADSASGAAADKLIPLTADDRTRLLRLIYRQTDLPNKPKNLVGMVKDIPPAEMEALLKAQIKPNADSLRALALQRGLAVRDALIARGLPSERLFLAAPKLHAAAPAEAGWTPRVQLSLSAN